MTTWELRVSDLSGAPGAEPVEFGLDGQWYSLDLSDDERAALAAARERHLPPFDEWRLARSGATGSGPRLSWSLSSEEAEDIEHWARENGFDPSRTGLSDEIVIAHDQYYGIRR